MPYRLGSDPTHNSHIMYCLKLNIPIQITKAFWSFCILYFKVQSSSYTFTLHIPCLTLCRMFEPQLTPIQLKAHFLLAKECNS